MSDINDTSRQGDAAPPPFAHATPPYAPPGGAAADERNWAMFGHLSSFAGLVIPFGNVLAPLVIWQLKKDTMPFAAEQSKEALNFNITVTIAALVSSILILVLIGFVLLAVVGVAWLVLTVMAGVAASRGENYRYPFTLRLIN